MYFKSELKYSKLMTSFPSFGDEKQLSGKTLLSYKFLLSRD